MAYTSEDTHFHNVEKKQKKKRQWIFTLCSAHILALKRNYWQSQGFPTWDEPHFLPLPGNICKRYITGTVRGIKKAVFNGKNNLKKHNNEHRTCLYIFGTWQLKQTDFSNERMVSWREEYEGLSLNGPGVTVTNSTSFCFFWWLDWRYKTATLSGVKFAHVRGLSKLL